LTTRTKAHARRTQLAATLALGGLLGISATAIAQTPASTPHAHQQAAAQTSATGAQDQELQKQIAELRAQVAKLQAALDQQQKPMPQTPTAGAPAGPAQAPGRRMMGEMGAMPPGGMRMSEMGGMGSGGMGMMDMDKGEMGMPPDGMKMPEGMMMGEMGMGQTPSGSSTSPSGGMSMGGGAAGGAPAAAGGMGGMTMGGGASAASPGARASRAPRSISSLPGMPGASHVYHIGSTGFFLDQPQLNLTTQQQTALNRMKERALLERGNAERRIEQAEQELWALTGADQPDAAKVQAKLQEIEQLRTNQRIGFIRAVGEATKQLTPEQQNALLGTAPPTK
jgi:Spy/CpxP family protein refolding chaperone